MDQEKIGKFIQYNRKRKKLTQEELAKKLGVNSKSVSRWETGKCMPDLSLINDLCKELNISVNEFLSGEKIDEKDYKEKLEENIINVTNYTLKKKEKSKIKRIWYVVLIVLMFFFLYFLVNTLDGSGVSFINLDEYFITRKINKRIIEQDIYYFNERIDFHYMYDLYKEFNSVVVDDNNQRVIYDSSNLMSFDEYKKDINDKLEKTLNKIKITKLINIDGYGNIFYNDTQIVDIQYGINPDDIVRYVFKNDRIELSLSYFREENNEQIGYQYLPTIFLKK